MKGNVIFFLIRKKIYIPLIRDQKGVLAIAAASGNVDLFVMEFFFISIVLILIFFCLLLNKNAESLTKTKLFYHLAL